MLRLLAQREEGYEDIGALTGQSVEEVRAKVRTALAGLEGGGPDPGSEDQKAMLRLLAQREEGYEDIGALLGLSTDQVRVKVREALAELDGEGSESPPRECAGPCRRSPRPAAAEAAPRRKQAAEPRPPAERLPASEQTPAGAGRRLRADPGPAGPVRDRGDRHRRQRRLGPSGRNRADRGRPRPRTRRCRRRRS